MDNNDDEEARLRTVALRNAQTILQARRRAEKELLDAREALERKNAQLLQQREWFEVTLSSIGDAVITTDIHGRVTFLNPVAEAMTGWTTTEAAGRELVEVFRIINEKTREPATNPVIRVLKEGQIVGLANHTLLISRDGSETAIEDSAAPIRDADNRIVGAVMVFHDVTARRRAEEALREETRALEILNRTGAAFAAQLDLETLVQTVTDAATQLSGAEFGSFFYTITDENGDAFKLFALSGAPREAFERFGHPRATPMFGPTFAGEPVIRIYDVLADPRYGQWSPHRGMPKGHLPVRSYLATPVKSRSGEVLGGLFFGHSQVGVFTERAERLVVGIAAQAAIAIDNARLYDAAQREIEIRQKAERALRRADRRKDEFLATLAHELRNPLAPIRQAAEIWKASSVTEAQLRWSHGVINRQVQHMSLLLDDLLDVSRITRGKLVVRKEWANLSDIVAAALETARPMLEARRHQLSVTLPETPVFLQADPLRLAQVLGNLLGNAAKYTEPDGRVALVVETNANEVTIRVTDSGIGIDADMLPQVFEMFSQTQSAIDRSEGGLGIGLALVRGLVGLHAGRVTAASEGPGRGSTFEVRLPIGTPPARVTSAESAPAGVEEGEPPSGPRTILLADDNRDSADSLAMVLSAMGHNVEIAYDGEAAVAAFESRKAEVVVLDIGMPKLNGYQVAKRIRAAAGDRPVTLIALTGWGQDSDKTRAVDAGFDYHFTKPLDPERLTELFPTIPR